MPLRKQLLAVALRIRTSDDAAVAIQIVGEADVGLPQHHLVAADQRIEGVFGRFALMFGSITFRGSYLSGFVRCGKRLSGRGQRRHFDGGEADFTSVIENKSAAVNDAADRCIYDCLTAADDLGPAVLRQRAAAPATIPTRRCNRSA
ncbi:MAG: hypothetical protein WBQ55_06225 [Xanthobacteraceae bacterium]